MNKFVKTNINHKSVITEYLQAINGLIRISEREQDVLAYLIESDMTYVFRDPEETKNVANAKVRHKIMDDLGITRDNLSTYIRKLVNKGLLIKGRPDEMHVLPDLIPSIAGDTIQILLVLKTDKHAT